MFGIGGEVEPPVLKIIWFEGDRTVIEVGIVGQHATAIDEYRVWLVGMALYEPLGHVRSHLHTVQDALYAQRCLVENLHGTTHCLLVYGITGLIKQEAESHIEDDSSKKHHPQTDPDRELTTDICDNLFHQLSIINCQLSILT
jgi:hypothetical protein